MSIVDSLHKSTVIIFLWPGLLLRHFDIDRPTNLLLYCFESVDDGQTFEHHKFTGIL